MPERLAEDLKEDGWAEYCLFISPAKLNRSPFRADRRYANLGMAEPRNLALGDYGSVFCLLAYRALKFGRPYAQTPWNKLIPSQFYLWQNGSFLDFDGWHRRKEIVGGDCRCDLRQVKWAGVIEAIQRLKLEERDYARLKEYFTEAIAAFPEKWSLGELKPAQRQGSQLPVGMLGNVLVRLKERWDDRKLVRIAENRAEMA